MVAVSVIGQLCVLIALVTRLSGNGINQFEKLSFYIGAWCELEANQLTQDLSTPKVLAANTSIFREP